MDEEEPAWKAELRKTLGGVAEKAISAWDAEVPGAEGALHDVLADMTLSALAPHIKAAEERGRREALTEAAEKIRQCFKIQPWGVWVEGWRAAADYIDPAKPESP